MDLPRKTNPFRENIASCDQVGLPLRSELPRGNVPQRAVRSVLIVVSLTLQNLLLRVNDREENFDVEVLVAQPPIEALAERITIHTTESSTPPSSSPQRRCSCTKAPRATISSSMAPTDTEFSSISFSASMRFRNWRFVCVSSWFVQSTYDRSRTGMSS
jgi:hypothetical protein